MNTHKTIDFSMDTGYYEPMDVSIDSVAEYQIMNAMEAVTAAEVMDIGLTEEEYSSGHGAHALAGKNGNGPSRCDPGWSPQ